MIIIKYKENNTIEGYVENKKEFEARLADINTERNTNDEIEFSDYEFELLEVNRF